MSCLPDGWTISTNDPRRMIYDLHLLAVDRRSKNQGAFRRRSMASKVASKALWHLDTWISIDKIPLFSRPNNCPKFILVVVTRRWLRWISKPSRRTPLISGGYPSCLGSIWLMIRCDVLREVIDTEGVTLVNVWRASLSICKHCNVNDRSGVYVYKYCFVGTSICICCVC